jgi:hypothetical protein
MEYVSFKWVRFGGYAPLDKWTPFLTMILVHLSQLHTYSMQGVQKGKIGITLVSHWCTPFSNSKSDVAAAIRQVDFMLGWYILSDPCKFYRNNFNKIHILLEYCWRSMDPLIRGDYPLSMRRLVQGRLPRFTKEQSELVKGAFDFIGLNYSLDTTLKTFLHPWTRAITQTLKLILLVRQQSVDQGRIQPMPSGSADPITSRRLQRNHCSLALMTPSPNEADPGALYS